MKTEEREINLYYSEDFSTLKLLSENRIIVLTHAKNLAKSIEENNLLFDNPILVDKELQILDGQHRYEACRILGVGFWYRIAEKMEAKDISSINSDQRNWKIDDYLSYWLFQKKEDYIQFNNFLLNSGMLKHPSLLLKLIGEDYKDFSKGSLKFPLSEIPHLENLIEKMNIVSNSFYWVFADRNFWSALDTALKNEKFDFDQFQKNLNMHGRKLFQKVRKKSDYLLIIEDIHNYDEKEKIDLQEAV
jgi:hypothetical protein